MERRIQVFLITRIVDVRTTMIYTHCVPGKTAKEAEVKSLLDSKLFDLVYAF
jgi:type VI protein secretion system component Hcp